MAQALLNYYPLPNANLGVLNPSYNYQTLVPNPSNSNGFDIRLDQNINAKQQLYVRYSFKNAFYTEYNNAGVIAPANNFLPNDGANEQNRSLVVSYNYSITPTLLNEFRFGFTNYNENDTFPIQGATAISQLGLVFDHPVNLASHPTGGCLPDLQFRRRLRYLDRAGPGWTNHFGKHAIHRQSHQDPGQAYASIWSGCPQRALQRPHVLLAVRRLWRLHLQRFADQLLLWRFSARVAEPVLLRGHGPTNECTHRAMGRIRSRRMAGEQPSHGQFRVTVGIASAVSGNQWRYSYLSSDVEQRDRRRSGQILSLYRKQFATYQQIYTGFLQGFNACSLPDKTPLLPCSNIETASQAGIPQGLRDWNWHDFDPRVSIAWRPFNNNKTVIRAGFGIYTMTTLGPMSFNSGIIALSDLLTYNNSVTNGVAAFQFPQTSPPGAPATLGGGDFEEGNNPHWKDPSSAQWNLTVERELTPNTTLRLSYTGQGSYHLPITIDLNQIPASTTPYTIPNNGYSVVDPRAPYQNWLLLMESESIGNQSYEAGTVEFTHRVSHGLTFQANYTWAKNISDAQGNDAPTVYASEEPYAVEIANRYDIKYDRGNVVGMPRQRVLLTGAYQLPFGAGQPLQGPGFVNAVLGGWNLSTVTTMQTGQWLTATMPAADDQSNTDMIERTTGGAIARPDCVGNPYANPSSQDFFNINAFALPPANAGRFGNCGVGILQGPGMINVNTGLAKVFQINERYRLRFEATFTNVLNHTNFAPPAMNIGNPSSFGVLQAALPQGNGGNRTGQLALRLDF